jgi:transposase-like protein
LSWRLAFAVICTKHLVMLFDRCPHCREPVSYYRNIRQINLQAAIDPLTTCHKCRIDYRFAEVNAAQPEISSSEIDFQLYLNRTLKQGWTVIDESGHIYSHLFFEGLYQILRMLFAGRHAEKVRGGVARFYGINITDLIKTRRAIPTLSKFDVYERRVLLQLASYLLKDWPNSYIKCCEANRISLKSMSQSSLTKASKPYWYWKVVNEHLNYSVYKRSEQEFASAVAHLQRIKGRIPKTKELSAYFGSQAFNRLRYDAPKQRTNEPRECPYCHSTQYQIKRGMVKNKYNPTGYQSFKCRACNRAYTPGIKPAVRPLPSAHNEAVRLHLQGNNYTQVARILSVSINSVSRWIKAYQAATTSDIQQSTEELI